MWSDKLGEVIPLKLEGEMWYEYLYKLIKVWNNGTVGKKCTEILQTYLEDEEERVSKEDIRG